MVTVIEAVGEGSLAFPSHSLTHRILSIDQGGDEIDPRNCINAVSSLEPPSAFLYLGLVARGLGWGGLGWGGGWAGREEGRCRADNTMVLVI